MAKKKAKKQKLPKLVYVREMPPCAGDKEGYLVVERAPLDHASSPELGEAEDVRKIGIYELVGTMTVTTTTTVSARSPL